MLASCKASYSVLVSVERMGAQTDGVVVKQDTPTEFLKDPSCWLPIDKMEAFLADIAKSMEVDDAEAFMREIGHNNVDLRAWGVLDSVLKMVESPRDIFSQPDRFLSYFLSPQPEIHIIKAEPNHISFEVKMEDHPYKLTMAYILGAVEGLPKYMSKPPAQIEQDGNIISINWYDDQESLFDESEQQRRQFHPQMVRSVMDSLQAHQKSIEEINRQSVRPLDASGDAEFEKRVAEEVDRRMARWIEQRKLFEDTLFKVKNDFYKLYDYFTRAQQLVTLISGSARRASVKEAMRRVDWNWVQKEFPNMIESACDSIIAMQEAVATIDQNQQGMASSGPHKQAIDLNELIDDVIEGLSLGSRQLKIDKHWLLDRKISVDPESFSNAIRQVLDASVSQSKNGGEVRVVTRPNGRKAEIEITDTGQGFDEETLMSIFTDTMAEEGLNLSQSQNIIRRHDGNISISSHHGEGATFLIELPLQ